MEFREVIQQAILARMVIAQAVSSDRLAGSQLRDKLIELGQGVDGLERHCEHPFTEENQYAHQHLQVLLGELTTVLNDEAVVLSRVMKSHDEPGDSAKSYNEGLKSYIENQVATVSAAVLTLLTANRIRKTFLHQQDHDRTFSVHRLVAERPDIFLNT